MSEEIFELSTDDGDDDALNLPGLASDGVPGLLVSVEFDDNLSDPIIDNGKVRMPRSGGSAPLAHFKKNEDGSTSVTAGLLQGMEFSSSISLPEASNGVVLFPLAQSHSYFSELGDASAVAGAIIGCMYSSSVSSPEINNGVIVLPLNNSEIPLASFVDRTTAIAGAVVSMYFQDGLSSIEANDGNVALPRAYFVPRSGVYTTGVTGGLHSVRYSADVTEPQIRNGDMLLPAEGLLKGVVDTTGYFHSWGNIQGFAGSEVKVATTMLQIDANTSIPISLSVGFNGKGLTFNLYNA
ncbi:MAG: hypothetical protein IJZ39_12195 [Oscillospiraceae bacterium]|nr:hypothetical protein [Oscillospiraceae bacterium]